MTETDTSREQLERAMEIIRDYVAEIKSERDRYGYIAATIRINAMRKGATDEQIEAFLSGEQSFIDWMVKVVEGVDSRALLDRAEKAEAERDAAWNDAIEAAAECVGHITQSEDRDAILTLKKGQPT